jgi:hypothetical protein
VALLREKEAGDLPKLGPIMLYPISAY